MVGRPLDFDLSWAVLSGHAQLVKCSGWKIFARVLQGRDLYRALLAMHSAFSFWQYLIVVRSVSSFSAGPALGCFVSIHVSHARPNCNKIGARCLFHFLWYVNTLCA